MPKNHQTIYKKPPNSDYGYKHRDLALLTESDVKTSFTCISALKQMVGVTLR